MQQNDVMTSGDIARHLKRPVSRVRYVLAKCDEFEPCGRAGIVYTSLLTGLWKAGKTTLLGHLLAKSCDGGELVGRVEPAQVLVVAEEGVGLWARRRDNLGIGDNTRFLIRPFMSKPYRPEWEHFIGYVVDLVVAESFDLVIFDTFATISPLRDENDAGRMLEALLPLHQITNAGASLLLVHHPRKGDATEGQASRGSGALPGFVDIIIELRRFSAEDRSDTRRTLTTYSRFDESPDEAVIELTPDGYQHVGSKRDAKQSDRMEIIGEILTSGLPGLTPVEVRDQWTGFDVPTPGQRVVYGDLQEGYTRRSWQRSGEGKRGDAYRYFLASVSILARSPSLGAGNEYEGCEGGSDA